jgi:hypothetical protein
VIRHPRLEGKVNLSTPTARRNMGGNPYRGY